MNDRSAVTNVACNGRRSAVSCRALVRSRTVTRGLAQPPVELAVAHVDGHHGAAPPCSRRSTKPPVELPRSRACSPGRRCRRPAGRDRACRRRATRSGAVRPRDRGLGGDLRARLVAHGAVHAHLAGEHAARAWARVAKRPRATSSVSSRSRTGYSACVSDGKRRRSHGLRREPHVAQQQLAVAVRHKAVRQTEAHHGHAPAQMLQHGAAEAAGQHVLLDRDEALVARRQLVQQARVQGLDKARVDHRGVLPALLQQGRRGARDGHARADADERRAGALLQHRRLPHGQRLQGGGRLEGRGQAARVAQRRRPSPARAVASMRCSSTWLEGAMTVKLGMARR